MTFSRALACEATLEEACRTALKSLVPMPSSSALAILGQLAEVGSGSFVAEVGQRGDAEGATRRFRSRARVGLCSRPEQQGDRAGY